MKTAPSEELQGVAEEIVEVDVDENKIIGDPNAPNKDTNTGCLLLAFCYLLFATCFLLLVTCF